MNFLLRISFWMACICLAVLSLLSVDFLPQGAFDWWDKAQHALAFLFLGMLGLYAYPAHAGRVVIGLLVYGAVIEVAQAATTWRYGDWQDWVADATGLGVAWLGQYLWQQVRMHRRI
jgi:VanZ family protein